MIVDILTKFNYRRKIYLTPEHPFCSYDDGFKMQYSSAVIMQAGRFSGRRHRACSVRRQLPLPQAPDRIRDRRFRGRLLCRSDGLQAGCHERLGRLCAGWLLEQRYHELCQLRHRCGHRHGRYVCHHLRHIQGRGLIFTG